MSMKKLLPSLLLLSLVLVPGGARAATLLNARTLVVAEPVTDNVYLYGNDVTIAAPISNDALTLGGTIAVSAPIGGDAGLAGGTVEVRKPVQGDVRAIAGEFFADSDVEGDLMVLAGTIHASTTAHDTHLAGGTITVAGSGGAVTVYGADVTLSGTLRGDVHVTASNKVTIAEGTHVQGTLFYDAPQEVSVPASAMIDGAVTYAGSSTFLPTDEEAKRFAVAGAGVLLLVRILAIAIAAGVVVGLFPLLATRVSERVLLHSPRRSILLALLGFAVLVATPVLILLLVVSFVGIALAILLAALYVLLFLLAYLYAGVIAGSALARALFKKQRVTWKVAVLGTLALYLVSIVPLVGSLVVAVLTSLALGSLIAISYKTAFGRGTTDEDVLEKDLLG